MTKGLFSPTDRRRWNEMLAQSFHPSQWFTGERDPDTPDVKGMWVYQCIPGCGYVIGYYAPNGDFVEESRDNSREAAAERVHWLNGGNRP
jgi:hypothetical protein